MSELITVKSEVRMPEGQSFPVIVGAIYSFSKRGFVIWRDAKVNVIGHATVEDVTPATAPSNAIAAVFYPVDDVD